MDASERNDRQIKSLGDWPRYIAMAGMGVALLTILGVPVPRSAIGDELQAAAFGAVPGHWSLNSHGFRDQWQPDAGYGPGIYAVPLGADELLAFDMDSATTAMCSRIDSKPFTLQYDSRPHYRFRCDGAWDSRDVIFVAGTSVVPRQGEKLEWHPSSASMLKLSSSNNGDAVHRYTATASPQLLHGDVLVSSAWFSGEHPPRQELSTSCIREGRRQIGREPTHPETG